MNYNYHELVQKIKEFKELIQKTFDKGARVDKRLASGKSRLKRFSLLKRIIFYWKFNGIRDILKARESERFMLVMMSLAMNKKLLRFEKNLRKKNII